jgi:hypothetical protein
MRGMIVTAARRFHAQWLQAWGIDRWWRVLSCNGWFAGRGAAEEFAAVSAAASMQVEPKIWYVWWSNLHRFSSCESSLQER